MLTNIKEDLTEKEKILWIAGLLEGEGCFRISKDKRGSESVCYIRITCEMTDEDTIVRLQKYVGSGSVHKHKPRTIRDSKIKSRKPTWCWSLSNMHDCFKLLVSIESYMSNRRTEKIEQAIKIIEEKVAIQQVKKCNPKCRVCSSSLIENNLAKTAHYENLCIECQRKKGRQRYHDRIKSI